MWDRPIELPDGRTAVVLEVVADPNQADDKTRLLTFLAMRISSLVIYNTDPTCYVSDCQLLIELGEKILKLRPKKGNPPLLIALHDLSNEISPHYRRMIAETPQPSPTKMSGFKSASVISSHILFCYPLPP